MPGIPKAVLAERDPELVREPCQLATAQIERFRPKAAEVPEGAGADAPAHPDLPCGHRVGLRTDDVRGRADRGPRRRSRVVQSPRREVAHRDDGRRVLGDGRGLCLLTSGLWVRAR